MDIDHFPAIGETMYRSTLQIKPGGKGGGFMEFINKEADLYIPDNTPEPEALARTTHMSIAAHQDDCEIMSYNAIAQCYGSVDEWYTAVVLTDGSGAPRSGAFADYTNEQMRKVRVGEQRRAADAGKYAAVVQLGYSSADVRTDRCGEVEDDLVRLLAAAHPEYVFIHNPVDRHETHLGACLRALGALRKLPPEARPKKVYGMEVWRSLDWLSSKDRLIFDTSKHPEAASAVITSFASQCSPLKRFDLAALGRRLGNATFQEPRDTDSTNSCNIGVDLTPLIEDPTMDIKEFALSLIRNFYGEAEDLLNRFAR